MSELTWLHLSDLHACNPRHGWDAKRVTDTLCVDLKQMQREQGLRPDLIFFTGDAAFGQIGKGKGQTIVEQFREAHDFLTVVRESFDPVIDQRNLFIVPGNHDVNKDRISKFETQWLENQKSLDNITQTLQENSTEWQRLIGRLSDYGRFLENYGYNHLLTGKEHLIYADAREVAGLRVGIVGFNSAWSSCGAGRSEIGRLWMAGRFQLETLRQQLPSHDFAIALMHHPTNWLVPEENSTFGRELERDFPFILHGHEHQDFVRAESSTGHTVISAGACHEWSESKNNGYNFVRLNVGAGTGEVWLRQYDSTGGGWIPRIVANRTVSNRPGCWFLDHLGPWTDRLSHKISDKEDMPSKNRVEKIDRGTSHSSQDDAEAQVESQKDLDPAIDYKQRYKKAVVKKLDYVQLFGIEVPKEAKEYSLTVAYVSLNLADEDELKDVDTDDLDDSDDAVDIAPTSLPTEDVFNDLQPGKGRLLIRGSAGCGKTTLLRWAAVQAANTEDHSDTQQLSRKSKTVRSSDRAIEELTPFSKSNWRQKIPFIIRLRDYPDGQLPRPRDFPLLLAKELPDPPDNWTEGLLQKGLALVMFDGVDEVPPTVRQQVIGDIRQLMHTYPDNYYVVTTRPTAVERQEFIEIGFISARVEPMVPRDRDIFIDRWHEAMEVRLRNWNEPEDLRPLASRLKKRLQETPAVARLTISPLLCAVVCALHRDRNENIPETPVGLCEKLCEMLLDRRDKERPGLDIRKNINEAYSRLKYEYRKGLLSQLAYYMVSSGISAIKEEDADKQIEAALGSYSLSDRNLSDISPIDIRRALVERSGMLQESSEQRIEFLHNTLKEFLAAERFFNIGNIQLLAEHADEESWQPVILFSVSLPRDGSSFTTELLERILENTSLDSPPKGRSKKNKQKAAKLRSRQFFFFRCCANAYQIISPEIIEAFNELSKQLIPPRNMTDAAALATAGEAVLPYLENSPKLKASEKAACVRTLGLIGGLRASSLLKGYYDEKTRTVGEKLLHYVEDCSQIRAIRIAVNKYGELPFWATRGIQELKSLQNLPTLTRLALHSTQVRDVSALSKLTNLTSLDLRSTSVRDVSTLSKLTNLTSLDLCSTSVKDVSTLSKLTNLTSLDLSFTQVNDVSALSNLPSLTSLDLSFTQVNDVSALSNLPSLTSL
ncbi:MAG: leucine-rich repeat domain-containing protein, partial [Cyanobacteria bacterium J06560_6]